MYTWFLFRVEDRSGDFERLKLEEAAIQDSLPKHFMNKCLEDPHNYYFTVQENLVEDIFGTIPAAA